MEACVRSIRHCGPLKIITLDDLLKPGINGRLTRKREIVDIRRACMYWLYKKGKHLNGQPYTTTDVGERFTLDHSSVCHHVKTYQHLAEHDPTYKKWDEDLTKIFETPKNPQHEILESVL